MEEPTIRVPATCPSCTKENLFSLPIASTAAALLTRSALKFNCSCQTEWNASEGERQQIREYLAVLSSAASETRSVALSD